MAKKKVQDPEDEQIADGLDEDPSVLFTSRPDLDEADQAEEQTEEQVDGEQEEQGVEQAAAEQAAESAKKWKFNGQEYSDDDLVGKFGTAEQIKDFLVTREQHRHLQQKQLEILERTRAPQVPQAATTTPQQEFTPDVLRRSVEADVDQLVKTGFLDEETKRLTPDVAAMIAYILRRESNFENVVRQEYEQRIAPLISYTQEGAARSESESFRSHLHGLMADVASSDETYAALADPQHREAFIQHLATNVDPVASRFYAEDAADFVKRQYVAYFGTEILKAQAGKSAAAHQAASGKRQNAAGERGTARAAGSGNKQLADIRELFGR